MQSSGSMNKEISVGNKNRAIDELDNSGNGLEYPVGHVLHKNLYSSLTAKGHGVQTAI